MSKRQDFDALRSHFDGSDENLLRSTHESVVSEHIHHYFARLDAIITRSQVGRVLDFGCGDGKILCEFAKNYPEVEFIGVDLSEKNIAVARELYSARNIRYEIAEGSRGDLSNLGIFDLVFSFSVIQYMDRDSMVSLCDNLDKVLSDHGTVVHMSIPDFQHIYRTAVGDSLGILDFSKIFLRLLKKYPNTSKRYGRNGFWWSRDHLMDLHATKFETVACLQGDSWYRFDIVCKR